MALLFPTLASCIGKMTGGEKRLARRFEALLEDDYLVWYDIPLGPRRRYPDFILLHPARGLLFLEVKDWKLEQLRRINHQSVTLLGSRGEVHCANPLEQARQCAYAAIDTLRQDPQLRHAEGRYQGNLVFPYGYGVVLPNITRARWNRALPEVAQEQVLPGHLVICQDEMTDSVDAETFQQRLWGMFNYRFGTQLSLPQIDRIRWHLFPELRLDQQQAHLFADEDTAPLLRQLDLPDIVRVLDLQQEQLARSLGDGHRVIHGVAGSGKTLILGYRCLHLANSIDKPIVVLCFNISLAARLRCFIAAKGVQDRVQVYHFHDWCGQQLKTYRVDVMPGHETYWQRQVRSVITGVARGRIPRGQYGAVLIDEGHDFEAEWLQLVAQMVDPDTQSLLLLYDDAQSIYRRRAGLDFNLSSVGIRARGRTTILRLNYRNTREILGLAYHFASEFIAPQDADDDHVPLVEPAAAGHNGPLPEFQRCADLDAELECAIRHLLSWRREGTRWSDMAIIFRKQWIGEKVKRRLVAADIPAHLLGSARQKKAYNPNDDKVALLTLHSSKGLEFRAVVLLGIGEIPSAPEELDGESRLLYVGMTRAREKLLITASRATPFAQRLDLVLAQMQAVQAAVS